jgi:peptidoglycan hydrolase-like protein with peptidoglycan-binding domain
MKQAIFALLATTALCLPAAAQNTPGAQPQQPQAQSQQQHPSGTTQNTANAPGNQQFGAGQQAQLGTNIPPSRLNEDQVRRIQQALDSRGFHVGVDGMWGPRTETALRDFQKAQKLPASGEFNQQTIMALGMNMAEFGLPNTPSTTGQGSPQSNQPNPNTPAQNPNGGAGQNRPGQPPSH